MKLDPQNKANLQPESSVDVVFEANATLKNLSTIEATDKQKFCKNKNWLSISRKVNGTFTAKKFINCWFFSISNIADFDYQENQQICFVGQTGRILYNIIVRIFRLDQWLKEAMKIRLILLHSNADVKHVFSMNGSIPETNLKE